MIFFHKKKKKLIQKKQPNEASFFVSLVLTAGFFSPRWQWSLFGSAPASCSGKDPTQALCGSSGSPRPSDSPPAAWHRWMGWDPGAEVSAHWGPRGRRCEFFPCSCGHGDSSTPSLAGTMC